MRQTGSGEVPDYAFYTCIPQQVRFTWSGDFIPGQVGITWSEMDLWKFTDICGTVLVFLHLAFNFKEADLGYFVYKLQ